MTVLRSRRDLLVQASAASLTAALGAPAAGRAGASAPMLDFARAEIAAAARAGGTPPPTTDFHVDPSLGEQAYRIERRGPAGWTVTGGDFAGAMYGGLDLAEALRLGPAAVARLARPRLHKPFVARRGIKYNVPLDLRTPSYSDGSTSARANIHEVWSRDFWAAFLDGLARQRFNMLSLWSLHPFPSMVRVPEFPDVALDDVWRSREPLGPAPFPPSGVDNVPARFLANHEVVKRIGIRGKIAFWRDVMQMAADRGIEVYVFAWNVFTYGAAGKYGIDDSMANPRTVAYLRASVRELVLTYPLLKGIGITAGENMPETPGVTKEQWLWSTYGEGVRDAIRRQPGRDVRLIHRFWLTSGDEIRTNWSRYPGWPATFSYSYKYSQAHMHSAVKPPFVAQVLPLLAGGMKTWLTVRPDDVYALRWGDVDYARQYVLNMPASDKLAGFYMGPDGFTWGRDVLDRRPPPGPRRLDLDKHWYAFMLWGRLAYDPALPDALFREAAAARFPGADAATLVAALAAASRIVPQTSRFFWRTNDLEWLPEACVRTAGRIAPQDAALLHLPPEDPHDAASFRQTFRGEPPGAHFYTVAEFMNGVTMPGAGVLNIRQWRYRHMAGLPTIGLQSPPEAADALAGDADSALHLADGLTGGTPEFRQTADDVRATAHLGHYYAAKIRGACALALFDATGAEADRAAAVGELETALAAWRRYAAVRDGQYLPGFYNRIGWIDITALAAAAAQDVAIARAWTPGRLRFDPDSAADQHIGMAYQEPVPVR